jgi:hypothetical protein
MNSAALKLVSRKLGVNVSIGTSRQKWWKALVGHWGWPLWDISFKSNVFGITIGNWENWIPKHSRAPSNCSTLEYYWENWENHCRNSLSKFSLISWSKFTTGFGFLILVDFICCRDIHICWPWQPIERKIWSELIRESP